MTAIDVIVHVQRDRAGRRRVASVHVVAPDEHGGIGTRPALRNTGDDLIEDAGLERLANALADRGWSP